MNSTTNNIATSFALFTSKPIPSSQKRQNSSSNSLSHSLSTLKKPDDENSKRQQTVKADLTSFITNNLLKKRGYAEMQNQSRPLPINPPTVPVTLPPDPIPPTPPSPEMSTSLAILDKFFYDDEKMIPSDNYLACPMYTPFTINSDTSTYVIKSRVKYPDIIYSMFKSVNDDDYRFSGVYTPLNIIYFVKGNTIFLWNYINNALTTYSEIRSPIYKIHITFPKKGIFTSNFNYIMLVATLKEIFLLLIDLRSDNSIEIHKTDFIYDVKGDIITAFASTITNRVFVAGKNNTVFELEYENTRSFFGFGKKAKKINRAKQSVIERIFPFSFYFPKNNYYIKLAVDNTRHMLYALSHASNSDDVFDLDRAVDSSVAIFDLGCEGKDFMKIGDIDQGSISEAFREGVSGEDDERNMFLIVDIIPLDRATMKSNQLLIITRNGMRVYVRFDIEIDESIIKDEANTLNLDSNRIYRKRIIPRFSFTVKAVPETRKKYYGNTPYQSSYNTNPEIVQHENSYGYDKITFFNAKSFIVHNDEVNEYKVIEVAEIDMKKIAKSETSPFSPSSLSLSASYQKVSEEITPTLTFEKTISLLDIAQLPKNSFFSECDLNSLIKSINYDNFLFPNIKFLDMETHCSLGCMHEFATQLFLVPEEYLIMLSDKMIKLIRLRPIDKLFSIIITDSGKFDEFENFINTYGTVETVVMLLMIMSNKNYIFYLKANVNQNESANSFTFTSSSYTGPGSGREVVEIKNNEKIILVAEKFFIRTLSMTLASVTSVDKIDGNNPESEKKMYDMHGPTLNTFNPFTNENNGIGTAFIDKQFKIGNFISHSMYLFISRICRLFYEESLFTKNEFVLYDNTDFYLSDTLQLHQLRYIKSIFVSFIAKMKSLSDTLFQQASDIDVKTRKIDVTGQYRTIIDNLFCDFSNFQNEYENLLLLAQSIVELLSFAEIVYDNVSLKKSLERKKLYEIIDIKFKDLLNKNYPFVLKALLEELFDAILVDNDYYTVSNKLKLISSMCPHIVNKSEIELIQAGLLLKLSKTQRQDDITKMNNVNRAVKLMLANPESIKIDKVCEILCENKEIRKLVELCVAKATHLHKEVVNNADVISLFNESNNETNNLSLTKASAKTTTLSIKEHTFTEYKNCIYLIFKLLSEVHYGILNDGVYNLSQRSSNTVVPPFIAETLSVCTREELNRIQTEIIDAVLSYNAPFLHSLLFDHLKNENMLEDLNRINSPYVEAYLNSEATKSAASPRRFVDLYKFYLNAKNYDAAIRILLSLVNFDNSTTTDAEAVLLEDRVAYVKHLLFALSSALGILEEDSQKKKVFIELKSKIIALESTLSIQLDIYRYLNRAIENLKNEEENFSAQIATTNEAILLLDRNVYNLDSLYFDFSKKFKIYQMNVKIYFEMFSKGIKVDEDEVKENLVSYLIMIKNNKNNVFLWPATSFLLFSQIFITFVEMKTQYNSFYSMLRENGFKNMLQDVIPITFIIEKVEKMNKEILFDDEDEDFDLKSNMSYENDHNIFWFVIFLKHKAQLPLFYIFDEYTKVENEVGQNDLKFLVFFNLIKLSIIKFWTENVQSFLINSTRKNRKISRQVLLDFNKFYEKESDLSEMIKRTYMLINKKDVKIMLNENKLNSLTKFLQKVESQFNAEMNNVINYNNMNKNNNNYEIIDSVSNISKSDKNFFLK